MKKGSDCGHNNWVLLHSDIGRSIYWCKSCGTIRIIGKDIIQGNDHPQTVDAKCEYSTPDKH